MERLKSAKILFNALTLLLLTFTLQAQEMSKPKLFLELEVNSEGLNYYIMFNNVKILNIVRNAATKETIPVNEWALNNNNILISVNIGKNNDAIDTANTTKLIVSLVLNVVDGKEKTKYILSTFNLKPSKDQPDIIASSSLENIKLDSKLQYVKSETGDVIISSLKHKPINNWIRFTQDIDINLNLPKWEYLSAEDLGDDQTMSDATYYGITGEIYLELQKIWSLMKEKNAPELLKLTKLRSSEYDIAYHLEAGNKQQAMERSFTSAFEHTDLYLDEIVDKERSRLAIEANGKIASLKVSGVGEPMIYYSHKDGAFTRFYHFYFMKKDGEWLIIR